MPQNLFVWFVFLFLFNIHPWNYYKTVRIVIYLNINV